MCKLPLGHFFGDLYKLLKNYGKHPGWDLPEKYRKITGRPLRPRRKYRKITGKLLETRRAVFFLNFPVIFVYFGCNWSVVQKPGVPPASDGGPITAKIHKNYRKITGKIPPDGFPVIFLQFFCIFGGAGEVGR